MRHRVFIETFTPRGVYPIATMKQELCTPDDPKQRRESFKTYGTMLHSEGMNNGKRKWKYERRTPEYVHITTITEV